MAAFLVKHQVVADPNQIDVLLHSVRHDHSGPYVAALEKRALRAYPATKINIDRHP